MQDLHPTAKILHTEAVHLADERKCQADLTKYGRHNPENLRNDYLEDSVEEGVEDRLRFSYSVDDPLITDFEPEMLNLVREHEGKRGKQLRERFRSER